VTGARATRLVAGRELKEAFRRKSLWIVLGVLFVGSSLAMILPEVLCSGTTEYDVAIVSSSSAPSTNRFERALRAAADANDNRVKFRSVATDARARELVDKSKVDLAVVLADDPSLIVRADQQDTLLALVRQSLATTELRANLGNEGLDDAAVQRALKLPAPRVVEVAVDDSDRGAAAAILSLVLYLVLLMLMIQAANGVAIEKANHVTEVLLAVVRPGSLLFGKVIGVGLVGAAGLVVGALPVIAKAVAGGDLPPGLGPAVLGGAAWFALGLVLYLTIAGSLGALVERQEEAGSVLGPLSLLLVGTYIVAQSAAGTSLGVFLAIFPLTSPIVMPSRIALGDATPIEIVVSLVVGIVTAVVVIRIGAAIFRRGVVHTGKRLHLMEALRSP
jgi:ABC-2 type transport system permease protein